MTTMEMVTALVTKLDALIGCLGCGEPVPADSLSDLFCARWDWSSTQLPVGEFAECGDCCGPSLISCQDSALDRMVHEPDEIYDRDEDEYCNRWARWWPGIEDGVPAPALNRADDWEPWTWASEDRS